MFDKLNDSFSGILKKIKGLTRINEENIKEMLKEIKISLLEADVNFKVVNDFVENIKQKSLGISVEKKLNPGEQLVGIVLSELSYLLGEENPNIELKGLSFLMLVGLQGSGKTSTVAKLAKFYNKKYNKKPLLVALDVYRPAAIDQLITLGEENNFDVFYEKNQKDVLKIAKDANRFAREKGYDCVIIDTAGRLHIDDVLMSELKSVQENIKIDKTYLVVNSMSGQDSVNVAKSFKENINLDGVIFTKLDGSARGGGALSIKYLTGLSVKFATIGEKVDDIEVFYADRMAKRILGMGDVVSLVEKVGEEIDEKEAKKTVNKMMSGRFTLDDMLKQMQQVDKIGSLGFMAKLIPGMPKLDELKSEEAKEKIRKTKAVIQSMTKEERENPSILKASRKRRIASGSGSSPADVNRVIKQYETSKEMMKSMKSMFKNNKIPF